jgi:5-(carboxyamino)imidazole ribonucleotide synthase
MAPTPPDTNLTLGILGDGQLAKMTAEAALDLGIAVRVLGSDPEGPCAGLGTFVRGDVHEAGDVAAFAATCSVVTLESEFIDPRVLAAAGDVLQPPVASFARIDNKADEKAEAERLGLPVAPYVVTDDPRAADLKVPFMAKLAKGGYDGTGNWAVRTDAERAAFLTDPPVGRWVIEDWVPFEREVAVTVARSTRGEVAAYPVVDTLQQDQVCTRVMAPSTVPTGVADEVTRLALVFAEGAQHTGVMTLEFFVTHEGAVLFNESSPRPHNSAHYTMDACATSQFEQHVRAVLGMPLGPTDMTVPAAVMLNLLGTYDGVAVRPAADEAQAARLHWYNKQQTRPGRKMGHATLVGDDRARLLRESDALEARRLT